MASGTIKGKFTGTATSNVYPEIRWKSTKNIASNNSSITAELWFIKVSSYWYPFNYNGYSASISINGNSASANRAFDLQNKSSQMVWSRTITVAHNADGKKSINISSSGNTGINLGNVSVSGTAKLDTIPRASSIGAVSGNQIGSAITIPISRASGTSFTHDVSLKLGSKTVSTTGAGTSAKLTPNLADFSGQLTSTTSGSATITVITKSGKTVIGTKTKSHTIYVPSSVKPSISGISTSETVKAVSDLGLGAKYVQNKSGVKVNATGNGIYGSTIKSLSITYNKQTLNGSGSIFSIGNVSGNQTITITTTDSRGRTGTATHVITVLPYSPPKIPVFKVWRDGTTNKVKASLECSINTFLKADGKTSTGGVWYIDANIGGVWGNKNSGQLNATTPSYKNTNISITGDYDITKSFSFRVRVHDAFGLGPAASANISTAKTLMDFNKDEGIGIGKMHERGVLDVGGDIYMPKGRTIVDGGGFYNGILPAGNMSSGPYWHQTIFPRGISHWHKNKDDPLTNPPGGVNGWGMVQVMKNQNGAGEFTAIYYTQANGRIFRTGGNSGSTNLTWYEVFSRATPEIEVSSLRSSSITSRGNIWADGNITAGGVLKGKMENGTISYASGFNSYAGKNSVEKTAGVVSIEGAIRNANAFGTNSVNFEQHVATLPSGYRPQQNRTVLMQGSGASLFLLRIETTGKMIITRYRTTQASNDYLVVPAGSWLTFTDTFVAGG